jgi:hypothetical protein
LETGPVSATLCSLEYQTMGKIQKPSDPNEGLIFLQKPLMHLLKTKVPNQKNLEEHQEAQ